MHNAMTHASPKPEEKYAIVCQNNPKNICNCQSLIKPDFFLKNKIQQNMKKFGCKVGRRLLCCRLFFIYMYVCCLYFSLMTLPSKT